MKTVNIYLNNNFEGGNTNFLNTNDDVDPEKKHRVSLNFLGNWFRTFKAE